MPTTETKRINPVLLWGSVIAAIGLAFLLYSLFSHDQVEIRAAEVTRGNLVNSVATNGKIEPIEEFQAYASVPGVVEKLYVDVGQKVKAGELLIKMDDYDASSRLATAQSSLQTAQSSLHDINQGGTQDERIGFAGELNQAQLRQQQAASDVASLKKLQQTGAASPAEVASAEQRLQTANNSLQSIQQRTTQRYSTTDRSRAEAQVADAKAAVAAAQNNYAAVNIRSKISGTVYSIPVSVSDYVAAGTNLLDVADLNHVQVRAYFDEPEIGKLAVGQPVKITWDAKPGKEWHGHISITPTTVITYGTRNVGESIITVDDAHEDLLPNTNVVVTVTTSQRFDVLNIPREALHVQGGYFVFRVVNNKLVRTPVQIGPGTNLKRAEISSGLTEKDIVAVGATTNRELSNGLSVKTVE